MHPMISFRFIPPFSFILIFRFCHQMMKSEQRTMICDLWFKQTAPTAHFFMFSVLYFFVVVGTAWIIQSFFYCNLFCCSLFGLIYSFLSLNGYIPRRWLVDFLKIISYNEKNPSHTAIRGGLRKSTSCKKTYKNVRRY